MNHSMNRHAKILISLVIALFILVMGWLLFSGAFLSS